MTTASSSAMLLYTISMALMGLTYLVGIGVAVASLRRLPRPSIVTIVALAVQLVALVGGAALPALLAATRDPSRSIADLMTTQATLSLVFTVMHVVAFALLFVAIFGRREEAPEGSGVR